MLNLSRFTRFSFSEVETISTTPVVHSSKGMNILRSKDSNKFQNPEILLKLFCACIYSILVEVYYERMCKITVLFKVHIFGPWSVWVGISFGSTGVISHLIPPLCALVALFVSRSANTTLEYSLLMLPPQTCNIFLLTVEVQIKIMQKKKKSL